jgi:hypothetical protein
MRHFTGMPSGSVKSETIEQANLVSMIKDWDKKGYIISAGCASS